MNNKAGWLFERFKNGIQLERIIANIKRLRQYPKASGIIIITGGAIAFNHAIFYKAAIVHIKRHAFGGDIHMKNSVPTGIGVAHAAVHFIGNKIKALFRLLVLYFKVHIGETELAQLRIIIIGG